MSNQQKKNTFYGAAAFLAMTTIIVKVIGAIYKIPLTALLPDEAYGDFNAAYNIYTFFLTISTAGLPVALSKTVSECNTLGRQNQKAKVFQVAFFAFLFMGLFSFVCMSVFSPIVAKYVLQNEKAVFAVLALSPSVLCTCICSAFRGYAQGHMNMVPTGISQVIEAVSKMFLGLALAFLILNSAIPDEDLKSRLSASGALLGVSIGSILSVVFLAVNHIRTNRRERITSNDTPDTSKQILSRLLKLAIPITLSSCTLTIVNLIDTGLVQSQLQTVFTAIQDGLTGISNSVLDIFPKAVAIFQDNLAAFQTEVLVNPGTQLNPVLDSARELYGVYSKTMSIYNLPFNLMVPLTACIVPGVSACIARRDRLGAQRTTESAMRISALIALPCGFGLFALGTPIIQLLTVGNVDETIAGPLLSILGIAALFVCIQVVASAILQANGIVNLPIITMVIGGVAKVIVSYTLVGNPKFMIFGAPIGTLTCFVIVSVLNLIVIKRMVPNPPRLIPVFVKPLIASVVMAAAAWGCQGLLARYFSGSFIKNAIATGGGILAGAVVYVILIVVLKVLSKEDLEMMPKGDKIAKLLRIR
ncbi:putative polysaccharide biosynthesis protein [Flavonifractor sp. An91]|uniref:putative polysaccharide biosynthesis protein n=1 Tax=Flavonifractor sp. An91 TaxID=1965665 RepID=UPI001FA8FAF1|nr:polysaccharide biosynthesis protein [Flavonifractor sp. An91]